MNCNTMETKMTYKHNLLNGLFNEYDTNVFIIADYEYYANGTPITHLALNDNGECCAISCETDDDIQFWEYDFEQIALTETQWEEIIEIVNDILL